MTGGTWPPNYTENKERIMGRMVISMMHAIIGIK